MRFVNEMTISSFYPFWNTLYTYIMGLVYLADSIGTINVLGGFLNFVSEVLFD